MQKIQSPAKLGGGNCIFTAVLGTFGAVIGKSTLLGGSNENLLTIRYFLGKGGRSKHKMLMLLLKGLRWGENKGIGRGRQRFPVK